MYWAGPISRVATRHRAERIRGEIPMTNDTQSGGTFYAAPPIAEPVLPWRPEYGSVEDAGEIVDLGSDVYVYSSPDYTLDVNTVFTIAPEGVAVVDSQLLPRH